MNKKTIFLFMAALLTLLSANAQPISEQEALVKAQQFFSKASLSNASRGRTPRKAPELKLVNNRSEFFAFNDEANGGYVVVSGDERMPDVLAYSYDGHFDADNMPCNMKAWMEEYAGQVNYLRAHPEAKVTRRAATERENVGPLLTCKFDQGPPYNSKCPVNVDWHCVTGCVATAMAQIMYYWQWPKQTTDVIPGGYECPYEMPAIPITTIDWDNMLNEYDIEENYSEKQIDAISTLMILCGTSVKTFYTPFKSSASTENVPMALFQYFDYDDLITLFYRDWFDTKEWELLMYEELNDKHPVLYSSSSLTSAGHAFVLDGYENGYFHVNWGWGGDGSYVLMTDNEGWDEYIVNHDAIIGIQPANPEIENLYAVLDKGKMTVCYDKEQANRSGLILPRKNEWTNYAEDIIECVIDPSFANIEVRDLSYFFEGLENIKSIKGMEYLNTSKARDMFGMFHSCYSLTELDVSDFKTDNVKTMSGMFSGCKSLTSLDVSGFKTDKVTTMDSMFSGCSSLTSLDVSGFKTDRVWDMGEMFWGCSSLTSLNVSGFKTENVKYMYDMFEGCSGLTSLDVSGFKTDKVTTMGSMFEGCSGLTSLDVSGFKTDKVTYMSDMFEGCSGLTSLDLSGFITDSVKNMTCMFSNCPNLSTIYVSELWNMSNVEESGDMFYSCTNIVGGAGTTYDENHTDGEYAHVDGGPDNPGYFTYKEIPDAISTITPDLQVVRIYNLQGKRLDRARKGLNIIHTSKGVKKIVVK